MKREFLEQFGLQKEQIDQILNQHSAEIGNALNKPTNNEEQQKITVDELNEKLEKANKTIKDLQSKNKENEALQQQIQQYQQDIEALNIQHSKDRISSYTSMKLKDHGAINVQAVLPFVDLEKGTINKDGSITGIDEQIDQVLSNEELKFLFKHEEDSVPKSQIEQPIRGGYEPTLGTTAPEKSLGQLMAEQFIESSTKTDGSSYWNSL